MKSILATSFLLALPLSATSNSNNGGNSNGAPFMIMSEITVESSAGGSIDDSKDAANAETSSDGAAAAALPGGDSTGGNDAANTESAISSAEESHNESGIGESGSGSDTEDEDEGVASTSSSPPLRTLRRLQAMLDDSDYASAPIQEASLQPVEGKHLIDEASASSSTQDKLWTSKDRVKYRRTRRTEKQRRQQREFEEHQARKARDMQRLMIIQEEREREEARRKGESLRNIQERQRRQQFVSRDESSELTDDDTDTDANEFELTNNPAYFSDGEQSDDFSEEEEPPHLPSQSSPEYGQHQQMPNHMNQMNQYGSGNYQHQFSPPQQRFGPDQHPPMPNMPQNYQQYPPQPQQNPQYSQFSDPHEQQIIQDARRYSQQYAAWAQAAANGYHYPPPQPPTTPEQPYNANQNLQVPPHQQHPASSFDPRYYQVPQQQQHYYPPRQIYPGNPQQQRHPYPHPMQNFEGIQQRNTATNRAQESRQQAEAEVQGVGVTGDAGTQRAVLADNAQSKNSATSSIRGPMGVQSAVVPPTSPLISTSPPRTPSLKSPEGPYCELVDESVS